MDPFAVRHQDLFYILAAFTNKRINDLACTVDLKKFSSKNLQAYTCRESLFICGINFDERFAKHLQNRWFHVKILIADNVIREADYVGEILRTR